VDITFDGSYATGGYSITPGQVGLGVNGRIIFALLPEISGYSLEWVPATQKLRVMQNGVGSSPNAEVPANAAGITGLVARCLFLGYGNG
jgi:hypothetical protein